MNHREKNIAIGVGVTVALAIIYFVIVSPYLADVDKTSNDIATANATLAANTQRLQLREVKAKVWKDILANGLKKHPEVTAAQSENALLQWVRYSGVQPIDRQRLAPTDLGVYQIINFNQSLTASMRTLTQFVNQIETTNLPIRLTNLDLTPVKDGQDNITAKLSISALCMPAVAPAATPAPAAPQPTEQP